MENGTWPVVPVLSDAGSNRYGELPSALTSVRSPSACGVACCGYLRLTFFLFDIILGKAFRIYYEWYDYVGHECIIREIICCNHGYVTPARM